MFHSRVFGFLAVALCLVACLCVCAAVSQQDAESAIEEVQQLAETVLKSAKGNQKSAKSILGDVEWHKRNAAVTLSQAEKAVNGNEEAQAVVEEVKKETDKVNAAYEGAKAAADAAVKGMNALVTKADNLKTEAYIDVEPDAEGSDDYTQAKNKASTVQAKVKELQEEMRGSSALLSPASDAESVMSKSVEKAKVKMYQVFIIVFSAEIDKELQNADADIRKTEEKRDELRKTLNEMKEFAKDPPKNLSIYVSVVLSSAQDELSTTSKAVDEAKKVKEAMLKQKELAAAALAKVKVETDPKEASSESRNVKEYVKEVKKKVPEIKSVLQAAEIAAENAQSRKKGFIRTLSNGKPQPVDGDNKVPNKPENPVKEAATKPTGKERGRPDDKNPGQPAKDGKKNPVDKGGMSTVGASNDSSITVSFSLLLAFIACGALH